MTGKLYKLRLRFTDDGCLWAADGLTAERFGHGPLERTALGSMPLPLTPELRERLYRLKVHHESQSAIGVEGYGPWTEAQLDRFNSRVQAVLIDLRRGLGPEFAVEYIE
jgi:hypothetical protein